MAHPTPTSAALRPFARAGAIAWILLASLAFTVAPALAQTASADWTQYQGGPAHPGMVAAGPQAPLAVGAIATFDDLPGGSSESLGLSAPVVSGTTTVVVGPTSVRALSVDGSELWSTTRDFGPSVPAAIYDLSVEGGVGCVRCQPLVLYTEGWGAGPGDPTSSATPTTSVRSSGGATTAALAAPSDGTSGTGNASPPAAAPASGPVASDLMARNLSDGSKAWDAPFQLKATSRTGVTVDGATAFVGDIRGNVYAVDVATGKERWTVNVNGFLESPIAASGGTLLVGVNGYSTENARIVGMSEETGKVSWVHDTDHPGFVTSPSAADGRVYFGVTSFGPTGLVPAVVALDLRSGSLSWQSPLLGSSVTFASAPSVTANQIFIEDTRGNVFAIDRTSGDRTWMFATNTTFAQGALIVVGDQVLVPADTGSLVVLDAATGHQLFMSQDAGGPLRFGAAIGTDRFIFTRGGPKPGLVAFTAATSGALTDIPSPTTPDYGKMIGGFAIAAAGFVIVGLGVLRPIARRMGPAFLIDADDTSADEQERP